MSNAEASLLRRRFFRQCIYDLKHLATRASAGELVWLFPAARGVQLNSIL
jgi:hypothetical protein